MLWKGILEAAFSDECGKSAFIGSDAACDVYNKEQTLLTHW